MSPGRSVYPKPCSLVPKMFSMASGMIAEGWHALDSEAGVAGTSTVWDLSAQQLAVTAAFDPGHTSDCSAAAHQLRHNESAEAAAIMKRGRQLVQRIFTGLLVAVIIARSAPAGEIADKAAQTESLVANGKYVEAIEAFDQAMISLWDKLPLTFRKALWIVVGSARGFGNYNPRETNVYRPGEEMVAYAEPVGFGWRKIRDDKRSDGIWQSDFAADITIKTKDGKHFHSQRDIGKGGMSSRARNREFNIRLTVTLTDIPAGEYMADFTVRDAVSGKRGTFSLPFVIK